MNGVLVVDKPSGWTSHDVVARMRGILKEPSIGHLGTLDPLATGVLPLVLGAATRLAQFTVFDKEYEAGCLLGRVADTEDVTGKTLEERPTGGLDPAEVERVFRGLVEVKEQVPPMVSAVKIGGVKLYEAARKGKILERKPRPVTIHEIEVLETAVPRVRFRVVCSGGTYVRTLCATAGEALGCGGCLETLVRTRVGPFRLPDAQALDSDPAAWKALGSGVLVGHLPEARLDAGRLARLCNGNEAEAAGTPDGWTRVTNPEGRLVAMAEAKGGVLHPRKVFGSEGI